MVRRRRGSSPVVKLERLSAKLEGQALVGSLWMAHELRHHDGGAAEIAVLVAAFLAFVFSRPVARWWCGRGEAPADRL